MLIRVPDSWPQPVVAILAMALLAVLDLAGAVAAKEAVERRSPAMAALGVLLFVLLFWVFASSLQVSELAPVTFGWVVILQVGVVLLDRFKYGVTLPTGKWVAIAILLVAQAYLLLGPTKEAPAAPSAAAGSPATVSPAGPSADSPVARIPQQRRPSIIDLTGSQAPMRHRA
jgi:hypothetical protein